MKLHKMKTLAGAVALLTLSAPGSVFAAFTGTQGNSSVLFNANVFETIAKSLFTLCRRVQTY